MFMHNKKLMYTVHVAEPNPVLANLMLEQFGGPQGELAAAMRYFTQGVAECDAGRKDLLLDIATEELSHLEIIGSIVCMLNAGGKAQLAEGLEEGELLRNITQGSDSHTTALLYGAGPLSQTPPACLGPQPMSTASRSQRPIYDRTSRPNRVPRSFTND